MQWQLSKDPSSNAARNAEVLAHRRHVSSIASMFSEDSEEEMTLAELLLEMDRKLELLVTQLGCRGGSTVVFNHRQEETISTTDGKSSLGKAQEETSPMHELSGHSCQEVSTGEGPVGDERHGRAQGARGPLDIDVVLSGDLNLTLGGGPGTRKEPTVLLESAEPPRVPPRSDHPVNLMLTSNRSKGGRQHRPFTSGHPRMPKSREVSPDNRHRGAEANGAGEMPATLDLARDRQLAVAGCDVSQSCSVSEFWQQESEASSAVMAQPSSPAPPAPPTSPVEKRGSDSVIVSTSNSIMATIVRGASRIQEGLGHSSSSGSLSIIMVKHGTSELVSNWKQKITRVRPRGKTVQKIWNFLDDPDRVRGGRLFANIMMAMICATSLLQVIETLDPPPLDITLVWFLELSFDFVCLMECIVRFVTCPNRIAFFLSFYNVIDMSSSLLPIAAAVTLETVHTADERGDKVVVSLLCFLPILRLLKLVRRFETFHLLLKAFRRALEALPVLLLTLCILVLSFASILFVVEPRGNIPSLSSALWLTIVTVGTIGYGDKVPESWLGHLVVSVMIVVSALYMAIPIGIVGQAFSLVWKDRDRLLLMERARRRFLLGGYQARDVPTLFRYFDADGDGELNITEFQSMLTQMQVDLSGGREFALFQAFDRDGSGTIDDQEFVRTLFPEAYTLIYGSTPDPGVDEEVQDKAAEDILEDLTSEKNTSGIHAVLSKNASGYHAQNPSSRASGFHNLAGMNPTASLAQVTIKKKRGKMLASANTSQDTHGEIS